MLANFLGVLPILTPPLCALAFIMCSKSNPLVSFALDLMSTYEGEHTIFGLLGQAKQTLKTPNSSYGYLPKINKNMCPHKHLYTNLHSSFIYNHLKDE
jgi:hypothetical protein